MEASFSLQTPWYEAYYPVPVVVVSSVDRTECGEGWWNFQKVCEALSSHKGTVLVAIVNHIVAHQAGRAGRG